MGNDIEAIQKELANLSVHGLVWHLGEETTTWDEVQFDEDDVPEVRMEDFGEYLALTRECEVVKVGNRKKLSSELPVADVLESSDTPIPAVFFDENFDVGCREVWQYVDLKGEKGLECAMVRRGDNCVGWDGMCVAAIQFGGGQCGWMEKFVSNHMCTISVI